MSPPVSGVGQGCSWVVPFFFVREILKELVASGSRIPCAALVGKYNPYPPRNTELSVNLKATPKRGAKLFLSVRTRPRPMPRPDCAAVATGSVAGMIGSRYCSVWLEATMNRPVLPLKVGSKL